MREAGPGEHCSEARGIGGLSLLKTVNYRESLGIFLCDLRTVGRHDHHPVCSRFRALVPVSQPSVAGTRACRPATSADRLAAATPSTPPVSFRRSTPVGVPLPSVAAGPRRLGTLMSVVKGLNNKNPFPCRSRGKEFRIKCAQGQR